MPGVTAVALLFVIAAWAIITGVFEVVAAIRLRKEIEGEFWLGSSGVVSVLFGALLLARPGAGALTVLWMFGAYAIAFSFVLFLLAFRLRKLGKQINRWLRRSFKRPSARTRQSCREFLALFGADCVAALVAVRPPA